MHCFIVLLVFIVNVGTVTSKNVELILLKKAIVLTALLLMISLIWNLLLKQAALLHTIASLKRVQYDYFCHLKINTYSNLNYPLKVVKNFDFINVRGLDIRFSRF